MLTTEQVAEIEKRRHEVTHATLHGPLPLATSMRFVADVGALLADRAEMERKVEGLKGIFDLVHAELTQQGATLQHEVERLKSELAVAAELLGVHQSEE